MKTPTLPTPYDVILSGVAMLIATDPDPMTPEGVLLAALAEAMEQYETVVFLIGKPDSA